MSRVLVLSLLALMALGSSNSVDQAHAGCLDRVLTFFKIENRKQLSAAASSLILSLCEKGFSVNVAEKLVAKYPDIALKIQSDSSVKAITVYRGLKVPKRKFNPKYRFTGKGSRDLMADLGYGDRRNFWVTTSLEKALIFVGKGKGTVVEYQIPSFMLGDFSDLVLSGRLLMEQVNDFDQTPFVSRIGDTEYVRFDDDESKSQSVVKQWHAFQD